MKPRKKNILSVQSSVASGYVGGNVANFIIQLHGFDPISLPTVMLSSHTGHKEVYGEAISPELFGLLVKGITAIGVLSDTEYLISGYFGSQKLIEITASLIDSLKKQSQDYCYIYDPVFGDKRVGGLYIPKEVADYSIQHLLSLSDILTPNHFELEYLLQTKIDTEEKLLQTINRHPILKEKTVVVTSSELKDTPKDKIEVSIVYNNNVTRIYADKIPLDVVGTGDLFSATLASQMNKGKDLVEAINTTVNYISNVLSFISRHKYDEPNSEALLKYIDLL